MQEIIEILKQFGAVIAISLTVVAVIVVAVLFLAELRKTKEELMK